MTEYKYELKTEVVPVILPERKIVNICKTCKHWNGRIYPDGMTLAGPCQIINDESFPSKPAWINIETKYPEFIESVNFNTQADFGCNLWQEE